MPSNSKPSSNPQDAGTAPAGANRPRIPDLGPKVPRAGNWLKRFLGRATFRAGGWRFEGFFPDEPKMVVIVAPHTSNWDVPLSVTVVWSTGIHANWIGKHTIFRWPFGTLMRWFGGIPVRRDSSQGLVSQIVAEFDRRENFVLGIAPEGTRKNVRDWRTGFWHIAKEAGAPIVPARLDYPRRCVIFGSPFVPTDDYQKDLAYLLDWYGRP